jgi:Tol biopolymer transport system component
VAVGLTVLIGTIKLAKAAFQGNNGKITFISDRETPGHDDIYMMNANGSNQIRLTTNQVQDSNPTFSPSGTLIAFDSDRDGNENIYRMNASDTDADGNGDNLKRLTKNTTNDEEPAFSANGKKIAFVSDRISPGGNRDIYVMKAKPEGKKNRPHILSQNAADDSEPSFSPDGTKIVFTSGRDDPQGDIYVMNSEGTGVTRLTSNPAFDSDPNFSPDGTKIVFRSGRVVGDNSEVFVMDAVDSDNDGEGDNMTDISNDSTANDAFPAFSPDNTKVVFRSNRNAGTGVDNPEQDYEVFVINANGIGGLTQLTKNDKADARPDWGVAPT